jgi:Na+-driven multidrug efflux pump
VTAINTFGVDAGAGTTAAAAINNVVIAVNSSFAATAATFIGQNLGAKSASRVKRTFWYLLGINVIITGTIGAVAFLNGRFLLGLIVGSAPKAVIDYGMVRMFYVTLFMFISAANSILTSAIQAFGYPLLVSITNIFFNLGFRVIWMKFAYPLNPTFSTIMLCFTVSWVLNMIFYIAFFAAVYLRYTRKGICKKI